MAALVSLSACSQSASSASTSATSEATPEATTSATSAVPAVAGYKPGEIPPVPLFKVPPIGVFASNADKAVIDATAKISSVPGVTVAPAVCDGSGLVTNGENTVLGGDGSGVSNNGDKQVVNSGDGSGVINEGPVSIVVDGTGGDVYNGPNLNIINNGDGTAMVKAFGEAEFWFALIKVATILIFMVLAIWAIITQAPMGDQTAGVHNIAENGGLLPQGIAPIFALTLGVVFAFGGTSTNGRWTLALFGGVVMAMVCGWYAIRGKFSSNDEAPHRLGE